MRHHNGSRQAQHYSSAPGRHRRSGAHFYHADGRSRAAPPRIYRGKRAAGEQFGRVIIAGGINSSGYFFLTNSL